MKLTRNDGLFFAAAFAVSFAILQGSYEIVEADHPARAQSWATIVAGMIGFGAIAWSILEAAADTRSAEARSALVQRKRLALAYAAELRNAYRMDPEELRAFILAVSFDVSKLHAALVDPMYSPSRIFDGTAGQIGIFEES
ncbi:MAG: hypothetical protein JWM77_3089, partial [Rhodospirillales bacterium]|nr:hypothetical protein [Rhodospirillales bacterium]